MYFDLFVPFPVASLPPTNKKKDKGKGKATYPPGTPTEERGRKSCWEGLESSEREEFACNFALAGHRESQLSDSHRLKPESFEIRWCGELMDLV
jgi:hypothetical protein